MASKNIYKSYGEITIIALLSLAVITLGIAATSFIQKKTQDVRTNAATSCTIITNVTTDQPNNNITAGQDFYCYVSLDPSFGQPSNITCALPNGGDICHYDGNYGFKGWGLNGQSANTAVFKCNTNCVSQNGAPANCNLPNSSFISGPNQLLGYNFSTSCGPQTGISININIAPYSNLTPTPTVNLPTVTLPPGVPTYTPSPNQPTIIPTATTVPPTSTPIPSPTPTLDPIACIAGDPPCNNDAWNKISQIQDPTIRSNLQQRFFTACGCRSPGIQGCPFDPLQPTIAISSCIGVAIPPDLSSVLPTQGPSSGTPLSGCDVAPPGNVCSPENLLAPKGPFNTLLDAQNASKICLAESGGNTDVPTNKGCISHLSPDYSVGLFQINSLSSNVCPHGFTSYTTNPPACSINSAPQTNGQLPVANCETELKIPSVNFDWAYYISNLAYQTTNGEKKWSKDWRAAAAKCNLN